MNPERKPTGVPGLQAPLKVADVDRWFREHFRPPGPSPDLWCRIEARLEPGQAVPFPTPARRWSWTWVAAAGMAAVALLSALLLQPPSAGHGPLLASLDAQYDILRSMAGSSGNPFAATGRTPAGDTNPFQLGPPPGEAPTEDNPFRSSPPRQN